MLEKFRYENAHGVELKIPKDTKTVIATSQKSSGILVNEFLESQNRGYLEKHKTVFIADISDIPTLFIKMIALPKFKKYNHEIYINLDEKLKNVVPYQKDRVTLLDLKDGEVKKIYFVSTKEELKTSMEKITLKEPR